MVTVREKSYLIMLKKQLQRAGRVDFGFPQTGQHIFIGMGSVDVSQDTFNAAFVET